MAGFKLLLSQSRRLSLPHFSSFASLPLHRSFSSSQSLPIQPVSYSPKPKDPQPDHCPQSTPASPEGPRSMWSREDLRYVKDVPNVSPISYPARVAPLPEDSSERGGEVKDEESEEMARESRGIQAESRVWKKHFRITAEEEKVPFPLLIMPEKKNEKRAVLDLTDAIREVKATAKANFDETVEAHVRLGIDQKRSELIVRGTMALPHGAKKEVRVVVFAEGIDADEAKAAGADIVGGVELIEEIASTGKVDFDRCFSTHSFMKRLYKISKILNQHGLMPNPKQGTVTKDVTKAVKEAKQGQVKFRMDKTSIVHVGIGKVSLSDELLRDNVGAFMNSLLQAKPAGLKKTSKYAGYVNSFHICSTMGPGFRVSIQSLSRAADHYSKVYLNA
ncbi:Ribosomal protein L1p/L10e family, putative isoform 2 [Hibiscus syriacus]|uniref:Large ribosomal subunit protein uL1c n=1 Tax=Hibiscus syriacus TaxID=106335 RepID=A0A6A2XTZ0_HIBSY|nr:50S ribosomal protein L1-like [Hibiscus syriacus]KAE8679093.1 Ribosomal protein L1p/L10e family, putative isoform 2 [Hibiscus syriacus]